MVSRSFYWLLSLVERSLFKTPSFFRKKIIYFFGAFFKEFLFCGEKEKLYLSSFSTIISLYQQ
ncbi:hypothetical protein EY650_12215 [Enterococcus faecalis]|uniref:Uncharacterized protein n=2 Tax=Enterococcus faecalis TaxID=1351 RepID=A0A125W3E1_ENTFL|nr:hypothetical protein HMPREF9498_02643 [Enterococcus faecalis TX4248]EFT90579.1 hypothetical protein HMPREF9497_02559 [Enterococcus faecalis TX4244]EFU03375.1 hypothetical protein HMPREF9508_00805 [Enterococcus faecalis TX0312]EGO8415803.1 hypothetical protein [Enterococcus faecalis]EPH79114.1 hypothetical protein D925_02574 [Enterococcus faecalis B83616-1]EPI28452.1 hypothetical protein D351_01760 [Enterococcus faecalis WKS-26-18-2]